MPQYLKTIVDVDGNAEIDVDVFENSGSEIHVTGKMKIKANRVSQAVLHQQYLASETSSASQSFFSSRVRHEKCYAQRVSLPVMTAGDLDMQGNISISLEGLVTSEHDIRISSKGSVLAASRAFYQTLDSVESACGLLSHATFQRFVSAPQIASTFFRANHDFILNALGNYYQTGVQSKIVGKKVVNARNIVSQSLQAERREVVSGNITNMSIGLPSSLTDFSFDGGAISGTSRQIMEMPPLFQSVHSLFNAKTSAQKGAALVQTGLSAHSTLKDLADTMNSDTTLFDSTLNISAKLFGLEDFGISHTHIYQSTTTQYGIPSVDYVTVDLEYRAANSAKFIGHQAQAQNITLSGGQVITVLPDVEEITESFSQRTTSFGYNVIVGNSRMAHGGMNGTSSSKIHHPSSFISVGTNTFQAPNISITNPLLEAQRNRFIGKTEFVTLYDVNRSNSSSFNFGLSFAGSLRSNIGVGKSQFYVETAPMSGVKRGIDVIGSLRNDSVPVTGGIRGDYSFFFRAPISENHGWGVLFSDINLSSSEAFSQSVMKSIRSGILGYTTGRLSQSIGFGDFASSVIGSLASAYASIDEKSR